MKNLLAIIFILFSTITYAQSQNVSYEMNESGLVRATYYNGTSIHQIGYFTIVDNVLVKHGDWKIFLDGSYIVRGRFENGQLVWIQRRGESKITADEIRVHKLERKVKRLEQLIASQP